MYVTSAIGAVYLLAFGSVMSLVYYDPSPKAKTGKTSGYVDLLYVIARPTMVLLNIFAGKFAASIICCLIIGSLLVFLAYQQPFYEARLNNSRFGLFFSAFVVSICSIAGAFANLNEQAGSQNQYIYVAVTLALGVLSFPIGYRLNVYFVRKMNQAIFVELKDELAIRKEKKLNKTKIMKSQLELIYENVDDVVMTTAMDHQVMVFPSPAWVEISARFIRHSYLSDKAVTLVIDLFEVAFEQFPRSAHVCISSFIFKLNVINSCISCILAT